MSGMIGQSDTVGTRIQNNKFPWISANIGPMSREMDDRGLQGREVGKKVATTKQSYNKKTKL